MNSTILAMLATTQAAFATLNFDQYRHYLELALTTEQAFQGKQYGIASWQLGLNTG